MFYLRNEADAFTALGPSFKPKITERVIYHGTLAEKTENANTRK